MPSYHPCPVDAVLTAVIEGKIQYPDIAVFLAILRKADLKARDGYLNGAYPGLDEIAQWAGFASRRHLAPKLKRLEAAGLVLIDRRASKKNTHVYRIPMVGTSERPRDSLSVPGTPKRPTSLGRHSVPMVGTSERPTTESPRKAHTERGAQAPETTTYRSDQPQSLGEVMRNILPADLREIAEQEAATIRTAKEDA